LNDDLTTTVEIGETVNRLMNNSDFKKIILDIYLNESVVMISANLSNVPVDKRQPLVEQLIARNVLRRYLTSLLDSAASAKQELAELAEAENEVIDNEGDLV
jgi:hypothetical protein